MKLYYGLTNYHLLCCILHKLIYNKNEKTVFVSSQGILKNRIEDLKNSNIFDDVYFLEDTDIRNDSFNSLNSTSSSNEIEYKISEFVLKYEKFLPFEIKDFDDIYLAADHGVLGIYVLAKKYKYNYMEDGRGIYSNWEILDNLLKIKNPSLQVVCSFLNAYGKSQLITKKYVAFDSQNSKFECNNCIDFRVNELLDKLSEKQLDTIFKIFGLKHYKINTNFKNALILTQRFSAYNMLNNEECILLYALLADFFTSDCNIYLKPHPADKSEYTKVFPIDNIIDRETPSELVRFIINKNFDIGICTYSSSINSLKNYINEIYNIDDSIVNYLKNIFKLYSLFEIAKSISAKLISIDDKIFNMFEQFYKLDYNCLISYGSDISEAKIKVKDYLFDDANLFLKINIVNKNPNLSIDIEDSEVLYVKVSDEKIKEDILNFKLNRLLKFSKLNIEIKIEERLG